MVALLPVMGLLFGGSGVIRLRLCYGARSTNTIIIALLVMTSFRLLLVSLINTSSATSMLRFAIYSVCLQFVLFSIDGHATGTTFICMILITSFTLIDSLLCALEGTVSWTRGGGVDRTCTLCRTWCTPGRVVMNSTTSPTLVPPAGMCLLPSATGMQPVHGTCI